MSWKNRIVETREMALAELIPNERNWRHHPAGQLRALAGVLAEVGLVQHVIFNQRTGRLVDGHLRLDLAAKEGRDSLPVTIVDLSEDEEALILGTLDPIGAMAQADVGKFEDLLAGIEVENEDLSSFLSDLSGGEKGNAGSCDSQIEAFEYRVIVECTDEQDQSSLVQRLEAMGRKCKLLIS